jgi:hypothetical protein
MLVLLVILTGNARATSPISPDQPSLIFVNLDSPDELRRFATTQLPMYEQLDGGLLTGADQLGQQVIRDVGLRFLVLDTDLRSGTYYLAETRTSHPAPDFSVYGLVLLKTNSAVLLKLDSSQVDPLTLAVVGLRLITLTPKPLSMTQSEGVFQNQIVPDPIIQGMIDQVTQEQVYQYDRELAGELPVWVDEDWYTIPSRYTYSGTPIQKVTHYVGQHLANELGPDEVDYHVWNNATNPNVIGEITGLINPEDIFIIGAHIDDVQGTPGADDNASGSVATLLAADILSKYQWGCTLRFAFWTGEEQGLAGSFPYAYRSYNLGENILGYLNLDMIAWNTIGSDPYINLIYTDRIPSTQEMAELYAEVIDTYNINLLARLGTGIGASDHTAFLQHGYPSILAIEDELGKDFNPYYHKPEDTPANTDPSYFTNFVKASIAAFAHMSDCLIPNGVGYLAGQITAESDGLPIEGVTISASSDQGHTYLSKTDANGYYTRTLLPDTYAVTAFTCSQFPSIVNGVEISVNNTTTLDFVLQQCQKAYFPLINR